MIRRLMNLIRGFFGLFVSGLERRNPEALLEVEKENLRKQMARYNEGLASHAGLCERLMTQVKRLESRERDLRAKAGANLKAGNRERAGNFALELQSVRAELEDNRQQLGQAEKTYKDLVSARDVAIQTARDKIQSLKRSIDDLKMQKAMAELNEMSSGMVSSIGGSGDTLGRLTEMVEEERQRAAGRARVARDSIDTTDFKAKEAEQKALADQALADFAAAEGMVLEPEGGQGAAEEAEGGAAKSMGPVAEDPS